MRDSNERHASLFIGTPLILGEIHSILLNAYREFDRQCHNGKRVLSELGQEVNNDEISWWVFRREADVNELRTKTKEALELAQKLKKDSVLLKKTSLESYEQLVMTLVNFAETHKEEIAALHKYVSWLSDKDSLAPIILYSSRTWGSTERTERNIDGAFNVQQCIEVVCGLLLRNIYTWDSICWDASENIYDEKDEKVEHIDPKETEYNKPIDVSEQMIISRVASKTLDAFVTYFTKLRDSLKHILVEIGKFNEPENLLHSEAFWRKFIEKAITMPTEDQLWDFKKTLDMWIDKNKEKEKSQIKFAEEVACFANRDGGVIIIGVTNDKTISGIDNDLTKIERWRYDTCKVIAERIEYDPNFVHLTLVDIEDENGKKKYCLLVVISQSCKTVGVNISEKNDQNIYTYPVRRGTGFYREKKSRIDSEKSNKEKDLFDFIREFNQMLYDR